MPIQYYETRMIVSKKINSIHNILLWSYKTMGKSMETHEE